MGNSIIVISEAMTIPVRIGTGKYASSGVPNSRNSPSTTQAETLIHWLPTFR